MSKSFFEVFFLSKSLWENPQNQKNIYKDDNKKCAQKCGKVQIHKVHVIFNKELCKRNIGSTVGNWNVGNWLGLHF